MNKTPFTTFATWVFEREYDCAYKSTDSLRDFLYHLTECGWFRINRDVKDVQLRASALFTHDRDTAIRFYEFLTRECDREWDSQISHLIEQIWYAVHTKSGSIPKQKAALRQAAFMDSPDRCMRISPR